MMETLVFWPFTLLLLFVLSSNSLVSFNVKKAENGSLWLGDLVYFDLFDVKGSIEEPDRGMYNVSIEVVKPVQMLVSGFVKMDKIEEDSASEKTQYVSEFRASNEFKLQTWCNLEKTEEGFKVEIQSELTRGDHLRVTYNLKCQRKESCPRITLSHSLSSHPLEIITFQSNADETCHESQSSDLIVNILLQSGIWPLLQTHLSQIFHFSGTEQNSWESMNATNPIGDVSVTANWNDAFMLKTASFTGKMFGLPSFDIEYDKREGFSFLVKSKLKSASLNHDEL